MPKQKGPKFKINVTGMTERQFDFVDKKADGGGTNRAVVVKRLIDEAIEREAENNE